MSSRRKNFFRIADLDGQYKSSFRSVRGMRNASTHGWHGTCQLSIHLAGPTDALCKISTSELYDTGCRIEWSSNLKLYRHDDARPANSSQGACSVLLKLRRGKRFEKTLENKNTTRKIKASCRVWCLV